MGTQLTLFDTNAGIPSVKVKRGTMARIHKASGVKYDTIRAALRFETKTPLARQIRAWAILEGGHVEYTGGTSDKSNI